LLPDQMNLLETLIADGEKIATQELPELKQLPSIVHALVARVEAAVPAIVGDILPKAAAPAAEQAAGEQSTVASTAASASTVEATPAAKAGETDAERAARLEGELAKIQALLSPPAAGAPAVS